jgi:uncharacterized protein (TIGR03382 family)
MQACDQTNDQQKWILDPLTSQIISKGATVFVESSSVFSRVFSFGEKVVPLLYGGSESAGGSDAGAKRQCVQIVPLAPPAPAPTPTRPPTPPSFPTPSFPTPSFPTPGWPTPSYPTPAGYPTPPLPPAPPPDTGNVKNSQTAPIVVGAVGGLAVLAVAVAAVFRRRRSNTGFGAAPLETPSTSLLFGSYAGSGQAVSAASLTTIEGDDDLQTMSKARQHYAPSAALSTFDNL